MLKPAGAPRIFGAGLIALDMVMSADPCTPIRSYAGGTCGNVLAILSFLGWQSFPIARMGDDAASDRVRSDLHQWGVRLDHASCQPTADTPIIVQEIRRRSDGAPTHRFSWACPKCGKWLPGFKAVTRACVDDVAGHLPGASVFFMDRLSRATLTLADRASQGGAIVMFEPSGKADERLVAEALKIAHVIKYADSRLAGISGVMEAGSTTLLEVQTLGTEGLRYRTGCEGSRGRWRSLSAVPAPRLADSCGSGDWCTAGLLAKLGARGMDGLASADADEIEAALRYGQALAAWNCGFEGARGAMYVCSRSALDEQIARMVDGDVAPITSEEPPLPVTGAPTCPACVPPPSPRGQVVLHRH
jgi:sugar/nucleoside kinase (ribokinase family)